MTGQLKVCPDKLSSWPDIVRWPANILSLVYEERGTQGTNVSPTTPFGLEGIISSSICIILVITLAHSVSVKIIFESLNLLSMHDLLRKKKYARRECVTYIKTCYRSVLLVQCSSGAWPLILWTPSFWCWLLVCLWIMRLMLRTHSWLYLAHDTVGFLTAFHCYCFILSHSIIPYTTTWGISAIWLA